jgi:hypothetical protein
MEITRIGAVLILEATVVLYALLNFKVGSMVVKILSNQVGLRTIYIIQKHVFFINTHPCQHKTSNSLDPL